jgi:hypothetical protein
MRKTLFLAAAEPNAVALDTRTLAAGDCGPTTVDARGLTQDLSDDILLRQDGAMTRPTARGAFSPRAARTAATVPVRQPPEPRTKITPKIKKSKICPFHA